MVNQNSEQIGREPGGNPFKKISRRDFIKLSGAGAFGFTVSKAEQVLQTVLDQAHRAKIDEGKILSEGDVETIGQTPKRSYVGIETASTKSDVILRHGTKYFTESTTERNAGPIAEAVKKGELTLGPKMKIEALEKPAIDISTEDGSGAQLPLALNSRIDHRYAPTYDLADDASVQFAKFKDGGEFAVIRIPTMKLMGGYNFALLGVDHPLFLPGGAGINQPKSISVDLQFVSEIIDPKEFPTSTIDIVILPRQLDDNRANPAMNFFAELRKKFPLCENIFEFDSYPHTTRVGEPMYLVIDRHLLVDIGISSINASLPGIPYAEVGPLSTRQSFKLPFFTGPRIV